MRSAGNFHPEWGYLAPAPSFMRTVRIALVATAIGATAGAVVVVSLVERPGSNDDNSSIAAHALVTSAPVIAAPAAAAPAKTAASAPSRSTAQQQRPPISAAPAAAVIATPIPSLVATASKPEIDASVPAPMPTTATGPAEALPSADGTPTAAPDATAPKKSVSKRHRYEAARRWQSANNAKKRWRDNRGFGPLLRLFSFRTGSSFSSN